jgi:MFS family permease
VLSPTIMAEHANRADRGKKIGLGFGVMWPSGAAGAALFSLLLLALNVQPDLRWRLVLALGAVPAISVLYLRRRMPETARYLARLEGDVDAATKVVRSVAGTPPRTRPMRDDRA